MSDFEVHPRGTTKEIAASRALARSINQLITQYGEGIIPLSILNAYEDLNDVYKMQMEGENV